jgi:hypothetical protein
MRKFIALLVAAIFTVSMIQTPVANARTHKPADKPITGTVKVTKTGDTITSVQLTANDEKSTVYKVKLDAKGLDLGKNYDGKTVTVKGKVGALDGNKELTVQSVQGDSSKSKSKSKTTN